MHIKNHKESHIRAILLKVVVFYLKNKEKKNYFVYQVG